jgi:SpoVK/Ycf46/Vps4 family AAA+-type ATPase
MAKSKKLPKPVFLEELDKQYRLRKKNVVLITGDIGGLFWSEERETFLPLEQCLYQSLNEKFYLATLDLAHSLVFFDSTKTQEEVVGLFDQRTGMTTGVIMAKLNTLIEESKYKPLGQIVLLQELFRVIRNARQHGQAEESKKVKPMCVVIRHAGSFFPQGNWDKLSESDRGRLVAFLTFVQDRSFVDSTDLIILVSDTKSDLNERIPVLPNAAHVEIALPDQDERLNFVRHIKATDGNIKLGGMNQTQFCEITAGLTLPNINDLIEESQATGEPITSEIILQEVNKLIQAKLGETIKVKYPTHTSDDIVGYGKVVKILKSVFRRCENPETAVSAIIVSGPNGVGKTFQVEGVAHESGRIVIELGNMRDSLYGGTDKGFEIFAWFIRTFGKILILMDEAHTALGSVHSPNTHETERRLHGNILKMMGNPAYLGKVLWCLMTSRPDELDPDTKSRAPIQIPVFDLKGDERKEFVKQLFKRKGIEISDDELEKILERTKHYSSRDFGFFVAETLTQMKETQGITPLQVLDIWSASTSIVTERYAQALIASQNCSYPDLLPEDFKDRSKCETELRDLKRLLNWG